MNIWLAMVIQVFIFYSIACHAGDFQVFSRLEQQGQRQIFFVKAQKHDFSPQQDAASCGFSDADNPLPMSLVQDISVKKWNKTSEANCPVLTPKQNDFGFFRKIMTWQPGAEHGNPDDVLVPREFKVSEEGQFGKSLSEIFSRNSSGELTDIATTGQMAVWEARLEDPVFSEAQPREWSWREIEALAYPLNFQKFLLANRNDRNPAFFYESGLWFTTVRSMQLEQETRGAAKEDRWFLPVVVRGDTDLVRAAPLATDVLWQGSAINQDSLGTWIRQWPRQSRESFYQELTSTTQYYQNRGGAVRVSLRGVGSDERLGLIVGRRPSIHFWNRSDLGDRVLSYLALKTRFQYFHNESQGAFPYSLVDTDGQLVLSSNCDFEIKSLGLDQFIVFNNACVAQNAGLQILTPKSLRDTTSPNNLNHESDGNIPLNQPVSMRLPDEQWQRRIDQWLAQIQSIARVGGVLHYGAYYYDMFFGIEEGWPIVAAAQWGLWEEAQSQIEIFFADWVLDRNNYHHQYRNGLANWYFSEVFRLMGGASQNLDRMRNLMPKLLDNVRWTHEARHREDSVRPPHLQGLLPRHIYGGDISTPAISLYSNFTNLKAVEETTDLQQRWLRATPSWEGGEAYRYQLHEAVKAITVMDGDLPFLPLAVDLGVTHRHEGPYARLTTDSLGNYYNLFAPTLLHLGQFRMNSEEFPLRLITDYIEKRGGLWASLPRFYRGLDAVYAIGYIHALLEASHDEMAFRNKALNALQSFFIHAASTDGMSVPEVAGLFQLRFQRDAYESVVRQSPWTYGFFDGMGYLNGDLNMTEPLGAGAGEGLWLIRKALIDETKDQRGLVSDGLILLPAVPRSWWQPGKQMEWHGMPTCFGKVDLHVDINQEGLADIVIRREPGVWESAVPMRHWKLRIWDKDRQVFVDRELPLQNNVRFRVSI